MNIYFVIGCQQAGKSTFRKKELSHLPCFDIWDYQEDTVTTRDVWRSYARHRRDCINEAKKGEDFVIEHTMFKAKRRAYYINRLKEHHLICYHILGEGCYGSPALDSFEPPTIQEGFVKIIEVKEQ